MRIKLVRTGGFIPITKSAETEVNLSDKELASLLITIRSNTAASKVKDGHYYELTAGSQSLAVDLEKVPEEYKELFNKLKNDLKIIK
jgi:hypothetical protein